MWQLCWHNLRNEWESGIILVFKAWYENMQLVHSIIEQSIILMEQSY